MKSHLFLQFAHWEELPNAFQHDDVRYPPTLVKHFLKEYTQVGDTVFDPFAGYGTTLWVAERMGRVGYGVELEAEKVAFARAKLQNPHRLLQGNSHQLGEVAKQAGWEPFSFSMSSPPYMAMGDSEDPLAGYSAKNKGYRTYLQELRAIYAQLRGLMQPAGIIVLEVANLKLNGTVTRLAWDVAEEVGQVLRFEGEVVVCWDKLGYGYEHSYCLVYSVL